MEGENQKRIQHDSICRSANDGLRMLRREAFGLEFLERHGLEKQTASGFKLIYGGSRFIRASRPVAAWMNDGDEADLGFSMSNEPINASLSLLNSAVERSSVESLRFAGIIGGGDQFLRMTVSLALSGKRLESVAGMDVNEAQVMNLRLLAEMENEMRASGTAFMPKRKGGVVRSNSESPNEIYANERGLFACGFGDLHFRERGSRQRRRMHAEHGSFVGPMLSGDAAEVVDTWTGRQVGEVCVDTDGAAVTRAKDRNGDIRETVLDRSARYCLVSSIMQPEEMPVINAFDADMLDYLVRVPAGDAPNIIYVSNLWQWDPRTLAAISGYVLEHGKFETGTLLASSSAYRPELSILVKSGGHV